MTTRLILCIAWALVALWPWTASAHDAGAWGGLFRSLDGGRTWFQANQGRVVTGALSVAVDPVNTGHILLGTDSGLLETRNGGRDWDTPAGAPAGAVLAIAIDERGTTALVGTAMALWRWRATDTWQALRPPPGAAPVRALVPGHAPGTLFLLGWRGAYRSEDEGESWTRIDDDLEAGAVTGVLQTSSALLCVAGGRLWRSTDAGHTWARAADGVQVIAPASRGGSLWAAGENGVLRSDDDGASWRLADGSSGQPDFDEPAAGAVHADVHAVYAQGASPELVHAATARGPYRSDDGGATWRRLRGGCYTRALWVDPAEPDHLLLGVADSVRDKNGRIEESVDGGARWLPASDGADAPWPEAMVERFRRLEDELVAVLSDGRLFARRDGQPAWRRILEELPAATDVAQLWRS
jgi:photosystem II stability/assembly factor-like uncharacterized protein